MSKLMRISELEQKNAQKPHYGNGIALAGGFDLGAKSPLDSRSVAKTINDRNAHVTGNRAYEGMLVYVEENQKTYQLIGSEWVEFGFNDEHFQAGIVDSLESEDTSKALSAKQGKVLNEKIASTKQELVGKIDGVEGKVTANEEAITGLVAKDAELDGKIAANAGKIGVVEGRLDTVEPKVTAVEGRLDKVEPKVTAVEEKLNTVEPKVTAVEEGLAQEILDRTAADSALEAKIGANTAAIEKEVTDRTQAVEGLEAKLEAEKTRVDGEIAKKQNVITGASDITLNNLTAEGTITVNGDLEVRGTTTTINSENLSIKDRMVELNSENASVDEVGIKAYTGADVAQGLIFKNGKWGVAEISDISTFANREAGTTFKTETVGDHKALATEEYVNAQIEAIDYSTMESEINTVKGRVSTVEGQVSTLEGQVSTLEGNVVTINSDIAGVKGRLDAVEPKVDAVKEKLNTVEPKVTAVEGRLDKVEPKVTAAESNIVALQGEVAKKANQTDLEAHVNNGELHITSEERTRIAAHEAEIVAGRGTVGSLNERFTAIESEIDALQAVEEVVEKINTPSNNIVLANAPINGKAKVIINSLVYIDGFSVEGSSLTWNASDFNIEADDHVVVCYKK